MQYTADEFNYADVPRPFKNPYYTRQLQGQGGKRNKSLKQILALERERVDRLLEDRKQRVLAAVAEEHGAGPAEGMQVDGAEEGAQRTPEDEARAAETERRLQEAFHEVVSYASVEAPPSLMPQKRYCDVTGLDAKYTDPKSTLRYHNPEVYDVLRTFQPAVIQAYLAASLNQAAPNARRRRVHLQLVHEIKQGQVFRRFQVPRIESLSHADRVCALARPSPIGEDQTWSHPQYIMRRILQLFMDSKLSKKVLFCVGTDSPFLTDDLFLRYELIGTPRDPRNPPRAIWTFISPSPRTDLHTFVDGQPLNHQGQLRDGSAPAQRVEWMLEIDVLGQPLIAWRVVFSREYADARTRAPGGGICQAGGCDAGGAGDDREAGGTGGD
ncbi:chromatin-remodeling complex subunit ies6 [Rhodotorula kratochvilovae]